MTHEKDIDVKELAKKDYLEGMKYKEIAEKYNVSINTVKSWKTRHGWDRKGVHTKEKKGAHKNSKRGAPENNKNAVGNSGGGAPLRNKNAETHGFFSKYLPEETLDIIQEIENRNPIDMQWDMIMFQYGAIVRSQRIMHVKDKDEIIKELKKKKVFESENSSSSEEEWEFQFAWERQATFLNAQSRAMAELRNYIKQYDEMCKSDLATEEQKLRIEKLKVEIDRVKEESNKNNSNEELKIIVDYGDEDGNS